MIINVKSQTELSSFWIVFEGSVQNEKNGIRAISHLLEHLICKNFDDLMLEFDRNGISWNAYTSNNRIVFYFNGLDRCLSKYREIIVNKLSTFMTTEEQFLNERKIVLEEYIDLFNSQSTSHYLNLYRKLFNYYDAIGSRKDLESLTYQDVKDFWQLQFSKPHKIINVSKNSEFNIDMEFSNITFDNKTTKGDYDYEREEFTNNSGKVSIIDLSNPISNHADIPYIKFICSMLGTGLQSPLYREVREKRGLVYYIQCSFDNLNDNDGIIVINSETSEKNAEIFQETIEYVLNNPEEFITQERLDTIKQFYTIHYEKQEINRYNSVDKYIDKDEWLIENILENITLEKVMEVYTKYFNFSDFYKSIDKSEF